MRRWVGILLGCALAARPGPAASSNPDTFGLGATESAVAGASAARVRDFSALHYDPAALTLIERPEVSLGIGGTISFLEARRPRGSDGVGLADPFGLHLGAATPLPLGGVLARRIYVGIALHVQPDALVHILARAPDEPFYPLYGNRTQRLVLLPGLAVRLPKGLSIGIAFNYLAGLRGNVAASDGVTRAIEPRVDEQVVSLLAVNAAVRWQATSRLAVALVYRQQFEIPFATVTRNRVAGQPIDIDVSASTLFTPHQLVLGGALELPRRVTGSLDLTWSHWSAWRGPYVDVKSELPLVGPIVSPPPATPFEDTVGVRGGLEWIAVQKRFSSLSLRGGYGFESRAAPAVQAGVTNLLDGHKHRLAAGGGVRFPLGRLEVRLDIFGQLDLVQPHRLDKRLAGAGERPPAAEALADELTDDPARPETLGVQVSNPGWPWIESGGLLWTLGGTATVELP
jgi:hypothetical protein